MRKQNKLVNTKNFFHAKKSTKKFVFVFYNIRPLIFPL